VEKIPRIVEYYSFVGKIHRLLVGPSITSLKNVSKAPHPGAFYSFARFIHACFIDLICAGADFDGVRVASCSGA